MGKHRHTQDKAFFTQTEKSEYSTNLYKKADRLPFSQLPFNCCALALTPFKNPVCTLEGHIFDLINIVPFIRKYKKNPCTGGPLENTKDLIKLTYSKNNEGNLCDPMSSKEFTDFSHIVAIRTSGNVYMYETVQELNVKVNNFRDLLNDTSFKQSDIIVLQDPKQIQKKVIKKFNYISQDFNFEPIDPVEQQKRLEFTNKNDSVQKVMKLYEQGQKEEKQLEKQKQAQMKVKSLKDFLDLERKMSVKEFIEEAIYFKQYKHDRETTNELASSITSTQMNQTNGQVHFRSLDESEIRKIIHNDVKNRQKKCHITIKTSVGDLTCLIHCNYAPLIAENFLELSEKDYYNNTKFHRLIKDFMIQGGDPTATGTGGDSIFHGVFEDQFHQKLRHNKKGILSMANSGLDTNKSQFFITFAECDHLDDKHSVFGEVVGCEDILNILNRWPCQKAKPIQDIILEKISITENPFRQTINDFRQKLIDKQFEDKLSDYKKEIEKERWIEDDDVFGFSNIPVKKEKDKTQSLGLNIKMY